MNRKHIIPSLLFAAILLLWFIPPVKQVNVFPADPNGRARDQTDPRSSLSPHKAEQAALFSGIDFLGIGYRKLEPHPDQASVDTNRYFLYLPGYLFAPHTSFSIENGNYYLTRGVLNSTSTSMLPGQLEKKKIVPRLERDPYSTIKGSVLLPLTQKQFNRFRAIFFLLLGATGIFFLLSLVLLPLRALYHISRGNAFGQFTGRSFYITGTGLVALALLPVCISCILEMICRSQIPQEAFYPASVALLENKSLLLAGLIVLLLASAFVQGNRMKKENDLTI